MIETIAFISGIIMLLFVAYAVSDISKTNSKDTLKNI